jgi:hypothetical protein
MDRGSGPVDRLRVNDETITAEGLWVGLRGQLAERAEVLDPQGYQNHVERLATQLIPDRVAEALLYQQASLRLPPEADTNIARHVDGEIRKIITSEHGGVQRRYEQHLAERGMTIDDVHEKLRREIMIASYLEQDIKPKVAEPTRKELLTVFEQNRHRWQKPARRQMSLIDLRVVEYLPDGVRNPSRAQSDSARAEARSTIQAIEVELRNGADFADLARRHSHGLHASEGGAWGFVTGGSVRERFEPAIQALSKLEEGEVSGVIETPDGFFLVRCDELQPAVEPKFQDVQLELKDRYLRESYNRLVAGLIADLQRKAHIEPRNLERFRAGAVEAAMQILGSKGS